MPQYWPATGGGNSSLEKSSSPPSFGVLRHHLKEVDRRVKSFLIVHQGALVFEYYRSDIADNSLQSVASITKSIVSALVGVALQNRYFRDLDRSITEYLPEVAALQIDPQVGKITLKHLLTMTAGFKWDQREIDMAADVQERAQFWEANLISQALARPVSQIPGSVFNYDNLVAHLVSVIIARASGMTAEAFLRRFLFGPLGISHFSWTADPGGNHWGSHGIHLTARDLLKFGCLFLNRGAWEGQQLISEAFVRASTTKQVSGGWPMYADYGYLWWIPKAGDPNEGFFANGFGGQHVYVLPDHELVIVMTAHLEAPVVRLQPLLNDFVRPILATQNGE